MVELEKSEQRNVSYDFSKCMYDPTTPGELLKVYPEFSVYEEFRAAESDNEIRIMIMITDAESPFRKVKDINQKVIGVCEFLKIDLSVEENKKLFDSIVSYTNERIFPMCGVYLQMQNNHNFTYWWNTNQLYYALMNEMGKPMSKNEKAGDYVRRNLQIQKQAEPILNDLLTIEASLFADSKMKAAIAKSKLKLTRTYAEMYSEENKTE